MLKRSLNIIELFIIGWLIFGIPGFYEETISTPRFYTKIDSIRILLDLMIISTLLFRAILIIKNFKKKYVELKKLKALEKVIYITCLISLIPDLSTWFQWYYFANLYVHFLILFAMPTLLWTVEVIERISTKSDKPKNYGLSLMIFTIPIIGYIAYLNSIN